MDTRNSFNGIEIREEFDYNPPCLTITQRNMGGEYINIQSYGDDRKPWIGPFCVAIWRVKYKPAFIETAKQLHKLHHLRNWLKIQIRFQEQRAIGFERGYEYMGNLSQFWSFDTYYKEKTGEIKLYA